MSKIIKLIILVILLAIFGKYIYQYLKRNGKNLFSFTEKAGSFIKRSVVKSIDAVGIGDTVKIEECRPISKNKTWVVMTPSIKEDLSIDKEVKS